MSDKLQVLDVIESSGVARTTQETLKAQFLPFYEQFQAWKQKAEGLVVTDASQLREMKMAREARLALKEIRVQARKLKEEMTREAKEESLREAKAISGVYNIIEYLIVPIEKHLQTQEDFAKIQEERRVAALRASRLEALEPYDGFVAPEVLDAIDTCPEQAFEHILATAKADKEAWEEAERKAEAERIAREKAEAEERERMRVENERLKAEARELERQMAVERAKAQAEKEKAEAEARAEREAIQAKLKAEQEARAAIEAQARKKAQAEAEEQSRKEEEARKAQAAPDREKLQAWAKEILAMMNRAPECQTKEAQKIANHFSGQLSGMAINLQRVIENL